MTTDEISTVVHAHACVHHGTVYRFRVAWIAPDQLVDPTLAHVLVHVHTSGATDSYDRRVATLYVMTPLHQPARIPLLLTAALQQHLATHNVDGSAQDPSGVAASVASCGDSALAP